MRKKLFSMLALLCLTAAGAWAQGTVYNSAVAVNNLKAGDILVEGAQVTTAPYYYLYFLKSRYFTNDNTTPASDPFQVDQIATVGANGLMTGLNYGETARPATESGEEGNAWEVTAVEGYNVKIVGITYDPNAVDVTPVTGQTNQWTLTMPAGNVELQVEYEPWKVTLLTNNDQWGTVEAVTGGGVKELTVPETWGSDMTTFSTADLPSDFVAVTDDEVAKAIPAPNGEGVVFLIYNFDGAKTKRVFYQDGAYTDIVNDELARNTLLTIVNNFKIYYTATGDVTANGDGTYSVAAGKSITLKATPKDGYQLAGWYKVEGNGGVTPLTDGTDAEQDTLTLTPEADVTIRAEFAELTYTVTLNDKTYGSNAHVTATVASQPATITADGKIEGVKQGQTVTLNAQQGYKFRKVEAKEGASGPRLISEATTEDYGMVVCAAGHLHDAKTAVPAGCTAVGILGKVTETGHGLILALQDAASQTWNTINGWESVTTYAGTTLKLLPDDAARGANLTSYTTLGSTIVSNWAVAQKSDYDAIFTNLGSTTGDNDGKTYDANVNAFITTGVGGTAISGDCWSATENGPDGSWAFKSVFWNNYDRSSSISVRPVLGF